VPLGRIGLLIALAVAGLAAPAAAAIPAGNLVVNPGAEDGGAATDDAQVFAPDFPWSTSAGFTQVTYGTAGFPSMQVAASIGGGNAFFAGGPANAGSTAEQSVNVTGAAAEIDSAAVTAVLSAHLGGVATQDDAATIDATFIAADNATLGTLTVGPVLDAERAGATTLVARSASAAVPPGTRTIRVRITATRAGGSYNDGYADNVSLSLNSDPDTVPDSPPVARFTAAPNPTCTGIPVQFDASASTSAARIVNYRFELDAGVSFLASPAAISHAFFVDSPSPTASWTPEWAAQPVDDSVFRAMMDYLVTTQREAREDRRLVDGLTGGSSSQPAKLDVILTITDARGAQATAVRRIDFAQSHPSRPRTGCPQPLGDTYASVSPPALSRPAVSGSNFVASVACKSPSTCLGAVAVSFSTPDVKRARRARPILLAGTTFSVAPGSKKRVRARLTRAGKRLLRQRKRVPARVTVGSVAPSGKLVRRSRKITLSRHRR
jgi:hypothetical protein